MLGAPQDPLADYRRRLGWANRDGHALHDQTAEFAASGAYSIWVNDQGDWWTGTFRVLIDPGKEAEKLDEFARLFGSYLDNVHAALNYLAYQFASQALLDDPSLGGSRGLHPEAVVFPIFKDRDLYREKNRIKKLPAKFSNPIEQVQPYNTGHNGLWLLHELARAFRHRIVHPAAVWPMSDFHGVLVNGVAISDVEVVYDGKPLKDGVEVIRWRLPAGTDRNPKVDPQVVISIGIAHPLCQGRRCMSVINDISVAVKEVMEQLEPLLG